MEDRIKEFFGVDEEEVNFILNKVKDNLNSGNIKFVIMMDSVGERLKDLILYVNQNSSFDIYAVQFEYYKFSKYEIIIPKMFGVEVKKATKSSTRVSWDYNKFLNDAKEKLEDNRFQILKRLTDFFVYNADIIQWGSGKTKGSINPIFSGLHKERKIINLTSEGRLGFHFAVNKEDSVEQRNKLNIFRKQIDEIGLPVLGSNDTNSIHFEIEEWGDKCDKIIEVLNANI